MNKEEKLIEEVAYYMANKIPPDDWYTYQLGEHAKQIIDLVRGSEWVSVDTPPEYDAVVDTLIFSTENKEYQRRVTDMLYSKRLGFEFSQRYHPAEYVAFWMPLPSPPTNKGESND